MVGSWYRFSVSETLLKKPAYDRSCRPKALCTNWCRVSLVEDTIEKIRLNCLLCSSASIGNAPRRRYTAESAVLEGND